MLLTNFNLRTIAAFISDKIKADAKKESRGEPTVALVRRRDREWHKGLPRVQLTQRVSVFRRP